MYIYIIHIFMYKHIQENSLSFARRTKKLFAVSFFCAFYCMCR